MLKLIILYFILFYIQCKYGISEIKNFDNQKLEILISFPYNNSIMLLTKTNTYLIDENNKITKNSFSISVDKISSTDFTISNSKIYFACTGKNAIEIYNLNDGKNIENLTYDNLNLTKTEHKCNVKINKENDILMFFNSYIFYNQTENMHYLIKQIITFNNKNNNLSQLNKYIFDKQLIYKEISEKYISCDFDYKNNIFCIYYDILKNTILSSYIELNNNNNIKIINEKQIYLMGKITNYTLINIDFYSFFICAYDSENSYLTFEKVIIDKIFDNKYEIQNNELLVLSYPINNFNFIQFNNNYLYITYNKEINNSNIITVSEVQYDIENNYIDIIETIDLVQQKDIKYMVSNIFNNQNNLLNIIYSSNSNNVNSFIITFPKLIQCKNSEYFLHSNETLSLKINEIIIDYTNKKNENILLLFNSSNGFVGNPKLTESLFTYNSNNYGKEYLQIGIEYVDTNLNRSFISNRCFIYIQVCNSACESCSEFSIEKYNTKCIKCNIQNKYYPTFNDTSLCFNSEEIIKRYYFNHINNKFMPCYKNCKTCYWGGTDENQLCTSCLDNFIYEQKNKNCIIKNCVGLYYIVNNNKICLDSQNTCPINYPYLIEIKNQCIEKCPSNLIQFSNICYEKCPTHLNNIISDDNGCHCQYYWISYADKSVKCLNKDEKCPNEYKFNNTYTLECLLTNDKPDIICNGKYWYIEKNETICVDFCPSNYQLMIIKTKQCVKECFGDYPFKYNAYCYNNCPQGTKIENNECKDIVLSDLEKLIKDIENLYKGSMRPSNDTLYHNSKFSIKVIKINDEEIKKYNQCFIHRNPVYLMTIEYIQPNRFVNTINIKYYDNNFNIVNLTCDKLIKDFNFTLNDYSIGTRYKKYIDKYNIDLLDKKSKYYNDICVLDFEDNKKENLNLYIRMKYYEFFPICEENCLYKGYYKIHSKIQIKCSCEVLDSSSKLYEYEDGRAIKYKEKNSLLVFKCIYHIFNWRNYKILDYRFIFNILYLLVLIFSIPYIFKKEKYGIPIPSTNESNTISNTNDSPSNQHNVVELASYTDKSKEIPMPIKESKVLINVHPTEESVLKRYCKILIKLHPIIFLIFEFSFLNIGIVLLCGLYSMAFTIYFHNSIFSSIVSIIVYLLIRIIKRKKTLGILNLIIGFFTWIYIILYFLIYGYIEIKFKIWVFSLIYQLILPLVYSIIILLLPIKCYQYYIE